MHIALKHIRNTVRHKENNFDFSLENLGVIEIMACGWFMLTKEKQVAVRKAEIYRPVILFVTHKVYCLFNRNVCILKKEITLSAKSMPRIAR